MNCIQKMLAAALGCVLSALLLTGCGEKEEPVNITLANHSGHGITSISITPSTSDEWDTELVDGIFQSGEMMEVSLGSYKPSELPDFNILVYNEESYVLYDNDVDEVDFTIHDGDYVVFLSPDGDDSIVVCTSEEYDNLYAGDGENAPTGYTAEELGQTGGMSGFSGCWKLENAPFYFVINDNYEWIAVNLYGEQVGPGYVVSEDDCIMLCMEDDTELVSLWQTANGDLSDANGNTLTASEYIMLLPTPDDELNQTACFPGSFTNVSIKYPIQMEAHEHPNVDNSLSFNAVMEDGTDDYYSNIVIAFQPISGYDSYMEKGAASAKPYMVKMLDDFMKGMYGDKLIQSFGSDFKDNGDYYSLTGYMWLDGSIFSDGPSQPVRGCMEVRYYGPTGYALVATTSRSRVESTTTLRFATTCSKPSPTPPDGAPRPSPYPLRQPIPAIPATTARHTTGMMKTATCGTGTAMKTSSSPTARTAILTTILANTWNPTMPAGITRMSTTTTTIRGLTPVTAGTITLTMTKVGATTLMSKIQALNVRCRCRAMSLYYLME